MIRLLISVSQLSYVLDYYDRIKIYRSDTEGGVYAEITTTSTRITLVAESTQYYFDDLRATPYKSFPLFWQKLDRVSIQY